MQKIILPLAFILLSKIATAQSSSNNTPNFFNLSFQADYHSEGNFGEDISYWVGFDNKNDYQENEFRKVMEQAAGHIERLKDSLGDPVAQRKMRIILYPDGKTVTFRLQETDQGKELTYHNGEYLPLKTTYDTVEIVHRKTKAGNPAAEIYTLYALRMKDLEDLPLAIRDAYSMDTTSQMLEKRIARKLPVVNKIRLGVAFGINVNSAVPIAPLLEFSLVHLLKQRDNGLRQFMGLYVSTAMGIRRDSMRILTDIGIELGSIRPGPGYLSQKASLVLGTQFLNARGEKYSKPMLLLGFNFPVRDNVSAGFKMAANLNANDNKSPNPKSNIGVNIKFNF